MIKNVLFEQKQEREWLLAGELVEREGLVAARAILESPVAKVIVGPRRAGKSVFAHLLLKGSSSAYVNLDDERLIANVASTDELLKALHDVYGDFHTLFLDEIQNIPQWELLVNRLLRGSCNVVITGSNANLLSAELATALTGRHAAIEVLPFSFREYLVAKKIPVNVEGPSTPAGDGLMLNIAGEYLRNGGYPEVVLGKVDPANYLSTLVDSILLKDVIRRYRIRQVELLHTMAMLLTAGISQEYSLNSLARATGAASVTTLQSYLGHLHDTWLFLELRRFSFKLKEQAKAPKKAYLVDNGIFSSRAFRFSPDMGRLLENAVFVELMRRGFNPARFDLYFYRTQQGREVDFFTRRSAVGETLIQVSYDLSSPKTLDRELKALVTASDETGVKDLKLITWDTEGERELDGKTISLIPAWKWMLEKRELST
ncbi:MAG: ATP-binding protein [Myxococcota bacterium]|jgi:hypothetical protein